MVGFTMFALLLVVGAGYWSAKLRQISGPGVSLPGARLFGVGRVAIAVLLAAGLVALIAWAVATPGVGSWPGLGFGLFAALEYVNYFHVQLMYDTGEDVRYLCSRGLRRAHLARDLDAHRRSRHRGPETASDAASIRR